MITDRQINRGQTSKRNLTDDKTAAQEAKSEDMF